MVEWTTEKWNETMAQEEIAAFYLYTPMCGTCAVASKMMDVIEQLLPYLKVGKANINFLGTFPLDVKVESVPCLLIARNGVVTDKIYAFQSVPYLYDLLKK